MLTADDFLDVLWDQIEQAEGSEEKLEAHLTNLSREDLCDFYNEFLRASSSLWATPVRSCLGDASEDTIKDTFDYLVAQGRAVYDEVLMHPERVPRDVDSNDVWVKGVVIGVYWDRFHARLPRYDLGEEP